MLLFVICFIVLFNYFYLSVKLGELLFNTSVVFRKDLI